MEVVSHLQLFRKYQTKNPAIKRLAYRLYEFGSGLAVSQSAALPHGIDPNTLQDQKDNVAWALAQLEAARFHQENNPIPDYPTTHPSQYEVDLSEPYETFVQGGGIDGSNQAINEECDFVCSVWLRNASELLVSASSCMAGTLLPVDADRIAGNLRALQTYLDTLVDVDMLDLGEAAFPGAGVGPVAG